MSDILAVFSWWLIIQLFGLAVWPLASRWLRWLPDRGYMLAKPIGLLLVTYVLWLLATIGLLPNSAGGAVFALIGVAGVGAWLYRRDAQRAALRAVWRERRAVFIAYEVVFVVALIGWALFRAHNPDLSTTEKPMEFAFFNAIGRSAQFPPHDPWLSGYAIAYYYFGYVMMSVLHRLSGITAGLAFGLSNAFWFALAAASAFGVVANLVLSVSAKAKAYAIGLGVTGAVLLVLMGNYQGPLELLHATGGGSPEFWTWLDIQEINQPPQPDRLGWPPARSSWWWWRASRVIHDYPPNTISPQLARVTGLPPAPNTTYVELIDEFPQFSFLLGDMHPHVLALPFALLMMALALNLYGGATTGEITSLWWGARPAPLWPLYAVAVGGMSFLNTWDFPIYAFVLVAALALGRWRADRLSWLDSLSDLAVLGVSGVLLYLPFYRGFSSQAAGIAPNVFNGTAFQQFFVMFGVFIIIGLMFGAKVTTDLIRAKRLNFGSFALKAAGGGVVISMALTMALAALGFIILRVSDKARGLWEGLVASITQAGLSVSDHVLARLADPWVVLLLAISLAAIVWLWRAARSSHGAPSASPVVDFVLLLFGVGALLTLGTEFAYIIDGFGSRMNTVFKFYYQAWALWSVAAAFGLYYLMAHTRSRAWRSGAAVVAASAIGLGLFYPALAIPEKARELPATATPTLDPVAYTAPYIPDEFAAIQWLNANIPGTPIILEATGEEYNASTSRFSTWTGLPTVVGWPGHEGQWRGDYEIQGPRMVTITQIYSTSDSAWALGQLRELNVRYVIVGPNEQRQFPASALAKFDALLPVVYEQGSVKIYAVR